MAYTKTEWTNNTAPYIDDTNLNKIEQGIYDNDQAITELDNNVDSKLGYDKYDNTSTYAVGDYCIYGNIIYVCNTAITTAEDFDSSKWTATSIKEEINTNTTNISNIQSSLQSTDFSGSVTFNETNYANYAFRCSGKVVAISYRGQAKTHTGDNIIFTIPSPYRPPNNIYAPFTKGGSAFGVLEIASTTGACRIVFISSTSSTDRLACNITYILAN